jgi:hypothetical protein
MDKNKELIEDLRRVLNQHSIDTAANTPDYLLAEYLNGCLDWYISTALQRDAWWKFHPEVGGKSYIEKS